MAACVDCGGLMICVGVLAACSSPAPEPRAAADAADGVELVELRHPADRADRRGHHRRDGVLGHARRRLPLRQPRRGLGRAHPRRRRQPAGRPRPVSRTASPRWRPTPTTAACSSASTTARSTRAAVRTRASAAPDTKQADARTFAAWGVDYLKYDWCRLDAGHNDQVKYFAAMRDALRASGRHIVYSINPNSSGDPDAGSEYDWSHIADVSRDAMDLVPAWGDDALWAEGLAGVSQAFDAAGPVAPRDGPRHVNDPDMLVVGIGWAEFVTGHPTMSLGPQRPDLTDTEQRAHFSLWAMLAAPLLAGNDVRSMTDDDARHPDQPRRHRRRPGSAGAARPSAARAIRG